MLPSLSCAESEHPTRQNTWVCLTLFSSYLTSSCRPANWERELAPHFRQPDVLPDGGQRSRGFRISSRKSPHYRSTHGLLSCLLEFLYFSPIPYCRSTRR